MRQDHFGNVLPGTIEDTLRRPLERSGRVWWPLGKLVANFIGLALLLGAVVWGW